MALWSAVMPDLNEKPIAQPAPPAWITGEHGYLLNAAALQGAPHSHIATIYAGEADEARILRDLAGTWPNITAIRVRDAIARATEALDTIATATAWAAAAVLATGFVVLIGAAAAGEPARVYESAVLKVLGASRARILAGFLLRAGLIRGRGRFCPDGRRP